MTKILLMTFASMVFLAGCVTDHEPPPQAKPRVIGEMTADDIVASYRASKTQGLSDEQYLRRISSRDPQWAHQSNFTRGDVLWFKEHGVSQKVIDYFNHY